LTSSQWNRSQLERLSEEVRAEALLLHRGELCVLNLVNFLKEKLLQGYIPNSSSEDQSSNISNSSTVAGTSEVVVVKIDHMRNYTAYIKSLRKWTGNLNLRSVLLISKNQGLYFLSVGHKDDLSRLMVAWKTETIDVDSRGKPCKEKMIQVIIREPWTQVISLQTFETIETDCLSSALTRLGFHSDFRRKIC